MIGVRIVLLRLLCLAMLAAPIAGAEKALRSAPPRLYVVGDSTAAAYPASRHPLTGWAQVLQVYFDAEKLVVVDKAISGRSSKSFRDEGAWAKVQARLKAGDYVMIQFGHNDSKKSDPRRYTEPATSYRRHLKLYVDEARAKGVVPILLTPVHRNSWAEDGRFRDTHGEYPAVVRRLAEEFGIPLIDLHTLTRALFERLGPGKTKRLFMNLNAKVWPNYLEGYSDNTHFQEQGAHAICRLLVSELLLMGLPLRDALLPPASSAGRRNCGDEVVAAPE